MQKDYKKQDEIFDDPLCESSKIEKAHVEKFFSDFLPLRLKEIVKTIFIKSKLSIDS